MIDQDRLERLLKYTEEFPASQIVIEFAAKNGPRFEMKSIELGDILRSVLFEVPALRKAFDTAREDIETLQEQITDGMSERSKWEYRFLGPIYNTTNEQLETQLNEMGRDGWELVNIEWEMNVEFEHGRAIFKRQK